MENGDFEPRSELNILKEYKIGVNFKKYSVLQKFWGKTFLPKTRGGLMPAKIIAEIAAYVEPQRSGSRLHRSIVTRTAHIEIQPDLTVFSPEHRFFATGVTLCVELKPKFGILFPGRVNSSKENCLNTSSRYCLTQLMRPASDRTGYCPCDFFSGNRGRMRRAIKQLIVNSQDKLRIFQDGQIVSTVDEDTVTRLMGMLLQRGQGDHGSGNHSLVDQFCDLLIEAVTFDKSETLKPVQVPFKISTSCRAHPWPPQHDCTRLPPSPNPSDLPTDPSGIPDGSVLGRLIHTDCLVDSTSEEMRAAYDTVRQFLALHHIDTKDNIFDLWDEHLITLEVPEEVRAAVRQLKKYVVALTIRDCSLMIKFSRSSDHHTTQFNNRDDNSLVMRAKDGTLLFTTIDIIDLSIKPLSKIEYNCDLERRLMAVFD